MQNTYEQSFKIRYSETDRHGRLKIRALFDYAQETAGEHAAMLGFSTPSLRQGNRTWMLSRIKYGIIDYPITGETIRVFTYPRNFDHLFARREFRFFHENGSMFAQASSLWLVVSLETMHIVQPDDAMKQSIPINDDLPLAFEDIGKILIRPDDSWKTIDTYPIRENMIDINCHLNNAECGAFLQNYLGNGRYASEIQINYALGIPPQSEVAVIAPETPAMDEFKLAVMLEGRQAIQMAGKYL